jgi:hypothetical protein
MSEKSKDAELVLKLYELRREEGLRKARRWFFTEFNPQSAGDILGILMSGHDGSAYYRMITSYWDMAASLVINGGIDEKMFTDANGEHVGVFSKIQPFIEEIRKTGGMPDYMRNLETLVMRTPNVEQRLERLRGIFANWAKQSQ